MNQLKVKKRDTSLEDFNYDKLLASLTKAGLDVNNAEVVAREIVEWAIANAVENVVTYVELREKVMNRLNEEFPAEANAYTFYKKE